MAATGMTCPKCSGEWDVRERNGVMIEECVGCHGVFLDRGELERLIDAESDYLANLDADTDGAGSYHGRHRRGIMHQIFTPAE
ncbi:TFIIB-type zinc ribbon-containing protein [Actinoallomurus rhizosphaericola]|uniref:TFIIB-type zinc ribbon-containing protein n=1 Tax=Actinoallomurus rhizosphaericola TaxID=2952536 RepID=UPI0027E34262|nr:zf-TFIIB domain-containing protein [Actinoallomurus rhizosphaericola]